jgi:hypothetical protein
LSYRDGRLQVGDEIVNIDGKRLRGLRLERARALLASSRNVVDAVISRTAPAAGPLQLAAAAATAAAAVDKEQEQAKDDLIRLTGSVSSEEEEVVRQTIITIGTEEVQMDEEEGEEGEVGGGRGVELVHTTVDTPQVQDYLKVRSHEMDLAFDDMYGYSFRP